MWSHSYKDLNQFIQSSISRTDEGQPRPKNVELTFTFLLYRGLVHHHHRILNEFWYIIKSKFEIWKVCKDIGKRKFEFVARTQFFYSCLLGWLCSFSSVDQRSRSEIWRNYLRMRNQKRFWNSWLTLRSLFLG